MSKFFHGFDEEDDLFNPSKDELLDFIDDPDDDEKPLKSFRIHADDVDEEGNVVPSKERDDIDKEKRYEDTVRSLKLVLLWTAVTLAFIGLLYIATDAYSYATRKAHTEQELEEARKELKLQKLEIEKMKLNNESESVTKDIVEE